MNGRIDLGFPEILLVCGTWSIVSDNFALGIAMGALGLLGALFRSALRMHHLQQEEQSRQQLLKEVNNAGSELGQVVMSLFKGTSGGDNNVH